MEEIPGWKWEWDLEIWINNYELLKDYQVKEHKIPSQSYETSCGIKLGTWVARQRKKKKNNKLSQQQIKLLEEIPGWKWEQDLFQQWFNNYELLKDYQLKEHKIPPGSYETSCGIKLGNWVDTQRQFKKKNKLSQEKIKLLEEIPGWKWEWDLFQQWFNNYELLKDYQQKENKLPSQSYETFCGIKLGNWVDTQRQEQKNNKLSQEKIKLLEEIPGWKWIVKK